MFKIIYENPLFKCEIDEESKILMSTAFKNTRDEPSTNEEVEDYITKLCNLILENKPESYIANGKDRSFIFSVEMQESISRAIAGACARVGLKKFAIILPEELIAALSTEQAVDEAGKTPFKISYFETFEKALVWVKSE
jgi:hypothetical protein